MNEYVLLALEGVGAVDLVPTFVPLWTKVRFDDVLFLGDGSVVDVAVVAVAVASSVPAPIGTIPKKKPKSEGRF